MPPLDPQLRRRLENTVVAARGEAEAGARAALEALAVAHHEPYTHMKPEARALRNHLRARARQLGDVQSAKGELGTDHLAHECAYEHWHRMLFARFLAENNLLIDPDSKVAVSLAECEELAKEEGVNTWEMAARFAQAMLPQIFRVDDPLLKVTLPTERRVALEGMLAELPTAVFTADDSLGWVYQFWQRDAKDAANEGVKSGAKINADTLPAVTQLFTEHYMVLFLLHNTIGAWWAAKQISAWPQGKLDKYGSEAELRAAVALPGYTFDYLRFVKDEASIGNGVGQWRPAAGAFPGWPRAAKELTVLDPSCGSGHFLVSVLELLVRLRVAEEGLSAADAVNAVLKDNLFGLELDQRCTQIAAFNVALAAWKLAGGKHIPLPDLHLACSGMGPNCTEDQWVKLAETRMSPGRRSASPTHALLPTHGREAIRSTLRDMHALFSKAPELGSLIDPTATAGTLGSADWETVKPFLTDVMAEEAKGDSESFERAVAAQGMAKAAEILAGDYTMVITNVPYLGRKSHSDFLKGWADVNAKEARKDLATMFLGRMRKWLRSNGGTFAAVTPQNWLFLSSYRQFRERLLRECGWNLVARLGPGAFETIGGHVVNVALVTISSKPWSPSGKQPATALLPMATLDLAAARTAGAKARLLRGDALPELPSSDGEERPELTLDAHTDGVDGDEDEDEADGAYLDEIAPATGVPRLSTQEQHLKNPDARIIFQDRANHDLMLKYANSWQGIKTSDDPRFTQQVWEQSAVDDGWRFYQRAPERLGPYTGRSEIIYWEDGYGRLTEVCQDGASFRGQSAWGRHGVAVHTMAGLSSTIYTGDLFSADVSIIDPKDQADLSPMWVFCSSAEFPTEVRKVDNALRVTNTALIKIPFDATRWKAHAMAAYPNGLPEPQSDDPTQWLFHGHPAGRVPLTTDPTAHTGTVLQVAVSRLAGYKWPAELDVEMRLALEARAWVEKCKELEGHADDDGVIPLVPMRGEPAAEGRVRDLLRAAFGAEWSSAKEATLLAAAAAANGEKSASANLDDWLKNRFFAEHCALFHHRPFVWHIWDGRKKDGFGVLVHYHRLAAPNGEGRRLLEKITHGYLGDWIGRQRDEMKSNKPGADARLAAALDLQKKLEAILEGEPPYDIFVRWKPLHEQPIGWEPDINDGVRMNIRPFVEAGVLREKVNVKWKTDRGQEPQKLRPKADFPWFWDGKEFKGDRVNDVHLTGTEKQQARDLKGVKA